MQSFRERSGFHGNQHCYQQEPHDESASRLEGYRHHHGGGRGYESHPLTAAPGSKDCYSLQAFPGYGTGDSAPPKKQYKEGKVSVLVQQQHLQQAGYTNHNHIMGPAYPAQYLNEGNLQQKWPDSSHLPHYDQESAGTVGTPSGSQYLEQNMLAVSQGQCPHTSQQPAPTYGSHHQRTLPRDTSPSPAVHNQGRLHFPQQPQPLPGPTQAYMDKCSPLPHCYKGYPVPPAAQYSRQLGGSSAGGGLKPSPYRSQSSYTYPQPPSRAGYEQLPGLQGMSPAQEGLSKYQHFGQPQQNYCLSDVSVRSPEQYYQNCSPGSGHSPARSMGRSPSYSSTPSPLMVSSETFQYSQQQPPIISTGPAPSSSSAASSSSGLQEQGLLMPPHSQAPQSTSHQKPSYTTTAKERFPEKLLSNPSLWSLNALTSQVESISNNVQQLLLSEALVGSRRAGRRGGSKKVDDYKSQPQMHEDASCSDAQDRGPLPEAYGAPQPTPAELQEVGYSSSSDEQLERSYYYCGQRQSRSPVMQARSSSHHALDAMSSCSLTSPDDTSTKSEDSVGTLQSVDSAGSGAGIQSTLRGECLDSMAQLSTARTGGNGNITLVKNIGEEGGCLHGGAVIPSPLRPHQGSSADMHSLREPLKKNVQGSAWSLVEGKEAEKEKGNMGYDIGPEVTNRQQQGDWPEDEKCPPVFHKVDKALMSKNLPSDVEDNIYQDLQSQYYSDQREPAGKASDPLGYSCDKDILPEVKSETYKSEAPTDYDTLGKTDPFIWRDDLRHQDHYLQAKVEDSVQHRQFGSEVEHFEEKLLSVMEDDKQEIPEEQCPIPLDLMTPEERLGNGNSPSSKNGVNPRLLSCNVGKIHSFVKEQGDEQQPNVDAAGIDPSVGERRPTVRDTLTSSFSTETVFPLQGEQAMPATQVRGHIEHRDAEVLEPDSPQLPGKSVMHPAPSWADTPPSPKKGDDDIEPGISCPSAVMPSPSAKSEPVALSSNLGALHRKHTRGRRGRPGRPAHIGARIRPLVNTEDKELPPVIASSKGTLFPDESIGISDIKDISSQTPKLSTPEGFPSRMRTRSFTTQAIPKTCAHLKRRPGPKPTDGCPASNPPPPPKGLISKIKCMKQRDLTQDAWSHTKGKRGLSLTSQLDGNQDKPSLPMLLPVKDQKSMVLRSRKQTEEMPVKEKEKKGITCSAPKKTKETKKQKAISSKDQGSVIPKPNLSSTFQKGVYKTAVEKLEAETVPLVSKRISSFQSPVPLKKKKGMKVSKMEVHEKPGPVETKIMGVRGPKRKLKGGEHLKTSFLTKDPPLLTSDIADFSSVPPHHPTKTKYLPPRKGRGLKYEAMVQKITSPGLKKQVQNPQVEDVLQGDLAPNVTTSTLQTLKEDMPKPVEVKMEEGRGSQSVATGTEVEACVKSATVGRRRGRPAEPRDRPETLLDAVPEVASLIINMPRLAKQRAIKNNREMHMKQSRRGKKAPPSAEQQDPTSASVSTPHSTLPPDSTLPTPSTIPLVPATPSCVEQPTDAVQTTIIPNSSVCKRGRPPGLPSLKRGRGKGLGKQSSKKTVAVTITRPKKKLKQNTETLSVKKKVHKPKVRHRKQCANHIVVSTAEEENWPEVPQKSKPQESKRVASECSFRPYVSIDSSNKLPSHCVIINRPEEETVLHREQRRRKRCSANVTATSIVTQATAPSFSQAMLQGPLVNAGLAGRCLTCCLCGKPANYRELGDLCGPYYPEDSVPRKALAFMPKSEHEEGGEMIGESGTLLPDTSPPKSDSIKGPGRWGRCSSGQLRRVGRVLGVGRTGRPSFREQYKRLRGWGGAGLRTLQMEAEAKEHWAHEACTIWTSRVVLIAGKLYGLTEATRAAAQTCCSACQTVGASISCCREGCSQIFHFVCAKDMGCLLQEDNFSLKCVEHKGPEHVHSDRAAPLDKKKAARSGAFRRAAAETPRAAFLTKGASRGPPRNANEGTAHACAPLQKRRSRKDIRAGLRQLKIRTWHFCSG
ncbi:hypothetical protein SKAU_G00291980 [Synaphobranchus kaupii]|uniref:PHD-type domain-containing protein n=1 Tax=Synaphobranchus kaupii TaxID=118154 RepID=A0A9Q1ETZ2_SYNKA|nr:hypothetical protein SKAU_G00291980 [Synaphobranchus kaupii]